MPKSSAIKHIFFDLDHTLWDFDANSKMAYAFIFTNNNVAIDIDTFIKVYTPINAAYWKLYRNDLVSKDALKFARLKDAFVQLSYPISDSLIYKLADEYLDALPNFNLLFDGCIDLLSYLKSKYVLHIITNGFSEIQVTKLKNAKIFKFFDQIITSESVLVKKPNPKIFFYALKKANAYTYQSIMIGDNLEADIYGAMNVGMRAIYCNFTNISGIKNIITIQKLIQLKAIL